MRFGRPTASLLVQLLTLTGLTLVAAWAMSALLVFMLPPPAPDFYRLSEIERTFRGQAPSFTERRPLMLETKDTPPGPELEGKTMPAIRDKIAADLGVPSSSVTIGGKRGPLADRRVGRIIRDRVARAGMREEEHFLVAPFEVGVRQPDGRWKVVEPERPFWLDDWQQRVAIWFALSALAMSPVAWIFARRLSQPIKVFAEAAERLGRDPNAPPLEVKGPAEVTTAARAFNEMQGRLRRYVEDRTAMMGAIAHDLRTPLTRLRFRIESLPEEQRVKYASDLDQMEEMITATLTFVRDATRPGERTPLELSSLVESLCDEMAETGAKTEVEPGEKVILEGDPMALRRLIANLLENAVKFGGQARARVFSDAGHAVVEIDDDGPGIPEKDAEKVFDPFYRREPSRSRQTGGIGLGLAIVRSIARGHGGDVSLTNRVGGGLTARVQLPL
ncbi:MAG: HAMP domain-containing protein [Alphaproteobacteria bacterium]|nr:HAMP domain-containing protein [Alphaproteobacteria bacterium]MBU1512873.1 HAMP domain-containing protein [Alphaproteobacteria bacterium]MBU2096686.1 HAMP domain-containing protein [Alphaproteobacteria bacterium]MBU2150569.1 HAMP domain-containing protein [Alphaproteobacteria bacterium]MBU2308067.1 HAMP domain-containing protein [Alphaproteobacteria bacterium]